ncbi:MAG: hypothetical protein IJM59_02975 [Proteobacteria bacterium]|nr:hypothetical protein [Pseudomonadota bacterium]
MRNSSALRYCILLGTAVLLSSCSDLTYDGMVEVCLVDRGDTCTCTTNSPDDNGDGVPDCLVDLVSECPEGSLKLFPGICGCDAEDTDTDGDKIPDCIDKCPKNKDKLEPGICGCNKADLDANDNGIADCKEGVKDDCPDDPDKTEPGECGCGTVDEDTDGDTILDCKDKCPADPAKTEPGECGCGTVDEDTDGDTIPDCKDKCPADPAKNFPGKCGCGVEDSADNTDDPDGNGIPACREPAFECPAGSAKQYAGVCGCEKADEDTDGDTILDCNDNCPKDSAKTEPGECGCGQPEIEGCMGAGIECPAGALKSHRGICGCNTEDTEENIADNDNDNVPNCLDGCPDDPEKIEPGECDCGHPETPGCMDPGDACPAGSVKPYAGICGCNIEDTEENAADDDNDNVPNCLDECPEDSNKTVQGICGCGIPDTGDADGDNVLDCVDKCPLNPNKIDPGNCGCNVADVGDGCDNTFHIYNAEDLFTYKSLGDQCSKYPNVVMHGEINLYDHYGDIGTHELGRNGDCNPSVFTGEKYLGKDPEIVFADDNGKRGKVSSPLFMFSGGSLIITVKNLNLSYDAEGDIRGVLAHSLNHSTFENVHYKGNVKTHIKERLISSTGNPDYLGGIAGLFRGNAKNISFEGNLNVDMVSGVTQKIGYLGGVFGHSGFQNDTSTVISDIHYKGDIKIDKNVDAVNVGGVVGRAFGTITNAVFEGGTLTYKPNPTKGEKYRIDTCIGGVIGSYNFGTITDSVLKDASVMADTCNNVGGIVGCLRSGTSLTGSCKESKAKIIKGFQNVGSVVGQAVSSKISKVSSIVDEVTANRVVGGFGGFLNKSEMSEITSKVSSKVSGSDYVAGFVGEFSSKNTASDIISNVGTIQTKYNDDVNFEKDTYLRLCTGGFTSFLITGSSEKINASYTNIQSSVETISSSLGTKVSGITGHDSGTGGFVGCLVLNRKDSVIHMSKIVSTVNKLESANHTAGFAGDAYLYLSNLQNFSIDNAFFWSNIVKDNSNASEAGILGNYDGSGKYGKYIRVVSASRFTDDKKSLYAFNNEANNKDNSLVQTDNKFYYYLWNPKVVAYYNNDIYSKFIPFGLKTGHPSPKEVKTVEEVLEGLNQNNNNLWSAKDVTVGGKIAKLPVFTATEGCK